MKAMMEDPQQTDAPAPVKEAPAPSDEVIRSKWPELAALYTDKPRLASMLNTTNILINGNDDSKMVVFKVVNQAQKEWVEAKLLHELEGNLRRIVGSMKVYLRVDVAPDDAPEQKKIYMPSDQAKELMAENEQVKNLVQRADCRRICQRNIVLRNHRHFSFRHRNTFVFKRFPNGLK
jgi:chromosomal replication initiation ATPase DnaA